MFKRKEFIWNTIASVTASALSAVLLLIVTRINGSDVAGMFAITFATATILNAIGDFGMRVFQVTDTNRQFEFNDYLFARFILSIIMICAAVLFCVFSSYEIDKFWLCILLVGYRVVEVISDTYQGDLQFYGRLDLASKSLFYRTLGAIIVFSITELLTQDIYISAISMIAWGLVISFVYDRKKIKEYSKLSFDFNLEKVKTLLVTCFPTFFSTLLNLYIVNAPKYAIDNVLNYSDQTVFSVIFLPTFTINLMSLFILKPILLSLGVMWNEKKISEFKIIIVKMLALIIGLTLFIEIVCYFIGIPILELIYGIELASYKVDLLILVISGGVSAISVMFFYALTTMRLQKLSAVPYILSSLAAVLICNPLVQSMGIRGAAWSSVIIMGVLCASSCLLVFFNLKRQEK